MKTVTTVGSSLTVEALRIALRKYLSRSNSTGSFVVHLGFGHLGAIFSDDPLRYAIQPRQRPTVVRVYSPEITQADFHLADAIQVNGELPETEATLFLPGEQSPVQDFTPYEKVAAYPYLNQRGQFTKSLWLVLQAREHEAA